MQTSRVTVAATDTRYLWRVLKRGHRVHIENPETERTWCQVENCGGKPFDGKGSEIPPGRRLCGNCTDLAGRNEADYREPDIRVLMGERLAEVEPDLFASWKAWAEKAGEHPGSRKRFADTLQSRGYPLKKGTGGVRGFEGIRLARPNYTDDARSGG